MSANVLLKLLNESRKRDNIYASFALYFIPFFSTSVSNSIKQEQEC